MIYFIDLEIYGFLVNLIFGVYHLLHPLCQNFFYLVFIIRVFDFFFFLVIK